MFTLTGSLACVVVLRKAKVILFIPGEIICLKEIILTVILNLSMIKYAFKWFLPEFHFILQRGNILGSIFFPSAKFKLPYILFLILNAFY